MGADAAAGNAMGNPKIANRFIGVGKSETIGGRGVGKERRVEIHAEIAGFAPINPCLKMFWGDGVAVDALAGGHLQIHGVKIQPMAAGDEGEGLFQVGAKLIGRAGFARIISGNGQPAAKYRAALLKTADVVPLPAMKTDRHGREAGNGGIAVDANVRIALLGDLVGLVDRRRFGSGHSARLCTRAGFGRQKLAKESVNTYLRRSPTA
jgi:hypothetical protein